MAKDPAFLFYPGDWNLGTMHMNLLEKGAYMELLMLQFARGKFTLAHAKHMLNGSFDIVWPCVSEKFKTDGTFFWNERLEEEKIKRSKYTESRRSNGSIKNQPNKNKKSYAKHMLNHMEDENENENVDINRTKKAPKIEILLPFPSDEFFDNWQQWKSYKKTEQKFSYKSPQSEQAALNSLSKLSKGSEQTAIAIIHQSMANGWKGFFELKQNSNGRTEITSAGKPGVTLSAI